ncbi:Hypothetical protein CINCED_3A008930 [Cinara cedri]|uniref:Uncharacterized protein n=1 Tax=Cinara cedri TaxID=506608 RepID=A0A5E4NK77_9HEMI|nr:Hypothetical protein CINCED_3A008930 [Cinara cedri]
MAVAGCGRVNGWHDRRWHREKKTNRYVGSDNEWHKHESPRRHTGNARSWLRIRLPTGRHSAGRKLCGDGGYAGTILG